ncbi:MAG: ArsR family transcriptional regulator [Deltaproteobacteria bacterium]|jgi:rhodanese-related sulfurtransferase|nr:ArsR family transcriptional regulator [Deltaproteobacteria bacterium]
MTPEKKRQVKNALYEEFARIGKAASSPRRLELLDLLSQGEKSVETLAEQAELTVKNTSAQLKVLRGARLVETRKSGQRVFYRLANQEVFRFWMSLQTLGEAQYAELRDISERYYSDPDGLLPIDRETLVNQARRGELVVIDVRPEDEYLAGHLPGARSIPIAELTKRLESLPKGKEIVAYCRGRYCVYAIDAVAVLRKNGFRAHRFEESVQQWAHAGLPVEQGSGELIPAAAGGAK